MNKLLSIYQRYNNGKKELLKNNNNAINTANENVLKQMLLLTDGIFFLLVMVSYTLPEFYELRSAYMIILIVSISISLFMSHHIFKKNALLGLYVLFIILFLYGVYASVIITPDQMATSIVGFFCIMPLAVIDKSWRINLLIIMLYLLHTFLVFQIKTPSIAMDDALTCAVFMICGIYIGENMRFTKLTNFNLQRNAEIQMNFDCLTGLWNRHKMVEKMKNSDQIDSNHPISAVIMLDIDHFKKFNDLYGHLKGDACLHSLGKTLKEFGEEKHLEFFRYGGEEFLAFNYGHKHEELIVLVEELRQRILHLQIPFEYSDTGCVTISLGFATNTCPDYHKSKSLIKMADQALYKAKETGRNKAIGYDQTMDD